MGYTHYFTKTNNPSEQEWDCIKTQIKALYEAITNEGVVIASGNGYPSRIFEDLLVGNDDSQIIFNGYYDQKGEDLSHETFSIIFEQYKDDLRNGFNFCKTNRKPYDKLVVGALIVIQNINKELYRISSDGDDEEWGEVLPWVNKVLGVNYTYDLEYEPKSNIKTKKAVADEQYNKIEMTEEILVI